MANLNIFGKDWTNLVFEGRNKEYGAYKLRTENSKNTLLATLFGLLLIGSVFGSVIMYEKFQTINIASADTDNVEVIEIVLPDLPEPEPIIDDIEEEPIPEPEPIDDGGASKNVIDEVEFRETVVKEDDKVKNEQLTAQKDFDDKTTSGQLNQKGDADDGNLKNKDGDLTGGASKDSQGRTRSETYTEEPDNKIHRIVQQKAEPVDGIKNFYTKFINKFQAPEIGSNVSQIKVTLKFVVEKDGTLTDIQVANDPHGAGKEAMRVLRTMPKWKPAQQNGKTVRSAFTLPITLKVN